MMVKYYFELIFLLFLVNNASSDCSLPNVLKGTWFSLENGKNTLTTFTETEMKRNKDDTSICTDIRKEHNVDYTIIFKNQSCYTCAKFFIRTVNVIEKIESPCVAIRNEEVFIDSVCKHLNSTEKLITLFFDSRDNRGSINCKKSLEGVWSLAYERPKLFSGKCDDPESTIKSCQIPDVLSLSINENFDVIYKECKEFPGTFSAHVLYGCLGDWYVGKNHYFAVFNSKESRKEKKYKCFIKNDDDDTVIGVSDTAECNTLKSPRESPEILHLTPVKTKPIEPKCNLPKNFTGQWRDSTNNNADIFINETHIIENDSINGKTKTTIYICQELRSNMAVMAKVAVVGCQHDYVCFDFMGKEENLIRYKKGKSTIHHQFDRACSYPLFINDENTKYDYYLKNTPEPVACPFQGKYKFTQKGDVLFETRPPVGINLPPRPDLTCKEKISDFSVSKLTGNKIEITKSYCLYTNHYGKPAESFSEPDYEIDCVANWVENNKSYLLTYEKADPIFQYRCWVFEKTNATNILLSQAIGSSCIKHQTVNSYNYTEGASVALKLQKYEADK